MQQVPISVSGETLRNVSLGTPLQGIIFLKPIILNDLTPLPLANTQSGNLFNDRFNAGLRWYLPKYNLAADPDQFFSFAASQSGVDKNGNPFNKGMLTLGLQKSIPDDVQALQNSNPNFQYQEIAPSNLVATLTTTFMDDAGQSSQNNYVGGIVVTLSGDLQLTFDNITGPGLIILYNNLQQKGAGVSISFSYDGWLQTGFKKVVVTPTLLNTVTEVPVFMRPQIIRMHQLIQTSPMVLNQFNPPPTAIQFHPVPPDPTPPPTVIQFHPVPPPTVIQFHPVAPDPAPPPILILHPLPPTVTTTGEDTFQRTTMAVSFQLPLDNKYISNVYSLKFTVSSDTFVAHPIINQNDLSGFNVKQSEFSELTVFGDIRQKYPSMSRLYMGVISRTIMVIPASYSIVRSTDGLSTLCQASLDSGSGSEAKSKFGFTFTIAPDVSSIDLMQLSQDINKIQELQGYTPVLPNFLKEGTTPQLMSAFQSSTLGLNAVEQHFFALEITIKDQINDSPAVVGANMLLGQLCQDQEPFLLATLSLKLDDNFTDPVETTAVLNFHKSVGTNELSFSVDNDLKTITFLNSSPFDLLISRYALCDDNGINVVPANLPIKSSESVSVPFTSSFGQLNVIVDSDINVAGVISKGDIEKFMVFQAVDIQTTKFTFGVNAASVDFDTPGISQIDVLVTLSELTDISVPLFSLVKLHSVNSSPAFVPIQNAIASLQANVLFTVHHIDPSTADINVNLQHEFIDNPILIIQNKDLVIQ